MTSPILSPNSNNKINKRASIKEGRANEMSIERKARAAATPRILKALDYHLCVT